ncbi:anti-sigma factor [Winogradskyella aurantiaca]|uniref:anti-sigma factor n=1 Tax=Winogradskyella aurantiaca TaxID=2219558 RepID=UPI0013005CE0|nr:anti-sigma factor [Winogradskyella aurantiaca]
MMTKDKILKEQLLEQYLLGDLEPAVSDQIELAISKDSSLKAMVDDMELDLEKLGQEHALSVPKTVKEHLMHEISNSNPSSKVRPMKPERFKAWFSLAAAASVILFLNTIYLIVQNGDIKQELTEISSESQQLKEQQRSLISSYNNQETLLAFISNPNTKQYSLEGNKLMPDTKIVSYVNHDEKQVMVNTAAMQELDPDHDYQMWADVEGEMINMGVINLNESMLAMTYIDDAESFNITIEPKGGSDHPTVERLISNVYL